MAKHLILTADASGNWRLPAETDVDELRRRLYEAMDEGEVVEVEVELHDDPLARQTMLVNGRTVTVAAVVETREPER